MKRIVVPMTGELFDAFRSRAKQEGIPMAEVARRLVLAWARGQIELPQPNEWTSRIYIYGLINPADGRIYYVGQSIDPVMRLGSHIYTRQEPRYIWLRNIIDAGLYPEIRILEETDRENALCTERKWIAYGLENGWPLANIVGRESD